MKFSRRKYIALLAGFAYACHAFGVTSGPTQPETQQFVQVGANDMVNLFSGDFTYNIALFELPGPNGGYPFNLSYKSGITMDQEATWTGLGWNVNVGAINRQMRCLPDEFNGTDSIIKKVDQLENKTIGAGMSFDIEKFGSTKQDVVKLSPSFGVSMYFNTYKGFGFTSEVGVGATFGKEDGMTGGIGLTVKNDNQEGTTISPNLSIGFTKGKKDADVGGSLNLGLNYNSSMGLQGISLGAGMSVSNQKDSKTKASDGKGNFGKGNSGSSAGFSGGATLSFNNSFIGSPSIKNPTKTSTFQGFFKLGGINTGIQFALGVSGNYSNETLLDKMKPLAYPAYGYFNLQKGQDDETAALDFIREKEATLHKNMRNLAAPVLTYDIYSVTGHGFSGMFRPYRSDIGRVNDKNVKSTSDGVNVSLDGSIGNLFQVGFSLNFPTTDNASGVWKPVTGSVDQKYQYTEFADNSLSEPYFFQVYGEKNVRDKEDMMALYGKLQPEYVDITKTGKLEFATTQRKGDDKGNLTAISTNQLSDRAPRQTDIKAIENKYLYDRSLVPECDAYYFNTTTSQIDTLDRSAKQNIYKPHHIGAFVVTAPDGMRYIYALPVYNFKQIENSFSVVTDYTEKDELNQVPDADFNASGGEVVHDFGYESYDKTITPAYVHAYLLTAVIGPDYVDKNEDGISDDDLGYWVKFEYKKSPETYKWRAPFTTANFIEGMHAIDADNMGTYNYGERESYYLYSAQTKSHKALFYTNNDRKDAYGAYDEIQETQILGAKSYKLDSIKLFSKLESGKPIKSVYFQYNKYNVGASDRFWVDNDHNELCEQVENAETNRGKLTLKAVYFTYGQNEKGLENPYIFNYNEDESDENPDYNPFSYDRWGYFQEYESGSDMLPIKHFPYTRQDVTLSEIDKWSAVWNLKDIVLPSGAKIKVNYEADRYSFVQNKPAMEMYRLKGVNQSSHSSEVEYYPVKNTGNATNYVTFTLKKPLDATKPLIANEQLKKYLDYTNQLYYKVYVDLNDDGQWEFITGYADIDSIRIVDDNTGKIYFKKVDLQAGKNPVRNEHPFALASWNYVQANRQELMHDNPKGPLESRGRTSEEVMGIIKTVLAAFNPLVGLSNFQDFYTKAYNHKWGAKIDYEKSFIRLNSWFSSIDTSTIEKFGGGSRVSSVLVYKSATEETEDELVTGQYFDYADVDADGIKFSTGVAANEPSIGGDECALKFGKIGFMEPKFKTSMLQFQEMPMNESYMPGPDVGYSKVTVASYATKQVMTEGLPSYVPTTGLSTHEFYTAKDYPSIFNETPLSPNNPKTITADNSKMAFNPMRGVITESFFAATQGYYSEINDMHGREKKISYFKLNNEGKPIANAISYVEYLYKDTVLTDAKSNTQYHRLKNEVPVIYNHLGTVENKYLGIDIENFIDTRQSENRNESIGGRFSLSVMVFPAFGIPIPIPTFFPDIGRDTRKAYTCVNNKIVHKFGILEKTKVFKEGALTESDNLVYDGYTGAPLLTSINNEFNDTIFSYSVPSHLIYEGMSPSYATDNLVVTGEVAELDEVKNEIAVSVPQLGTVRNFIREGDELIVQSTFEDPYNEDEETASGYQRCYVMRVNEEENKIWLQASNGIEPGLTGQATMYILRPYNRNILAGQSGGVVSKNNPLRDKISFDCDE